MKNIILLQCLLCLYGCSCFQKIPETSPLIEFSIFTNQKEVIDTLTFQVQVKNSSDKDIWLVQGNTFCTGNDLTWGLEVLYHDSIELGSPVLPNSIITRSSYICVRSGNVYSFESKVDLGIWQPDYLLFGKGNKNYGDYKIRLTYFDVFHLKFKSLKGKYQSNEIKIIYGKT